MAGRQRPDSECVQHAARRSTDFYEREVDYDLENISAAIEPMLIFSVGAMVLVLALGIFLPMWDMAASGGGFGRGCAIDHRGQGFCQLSLRVLPRQLMPVR
jgi:hypothetical protein